MHAQRVRARAFALFSLPRLAPYSATWRNLPTLPKNPAKLPNPKRPSPKPRNPKRIGPTCSRSGRRWPNCSIPRSTAAMPAWARAPACSRRRTIPGTAAPAARPPRIARGPRRAGTSEDVAKRDASRPGLRRSAAGQLRHLGHHPDARSGTGAAARPADRGRRRRGAGAAAAQQDGSARRQGDRRRAGEPDPRRPPGIQGRRRPDQESGRRTGRRARKNPKAACASRSSPNTSRRATSRPRSRNWSRASTATTARRCCSASPAPARPTPWPR